MKGVPHANQDRHRAAVHCRRPGLDRHIRCPDGGITSPKVQLPSGETVWDLSGDWEAFIENYGPIKAAGTYPNVYRITQTGSAFQAIRLRDTPDGYGKAGSLSLQGELEGMGSSAWQSCSGVAKYCQARAHQ